MGTQDRNQHEALMTKDRTPEIWPGQHPKLQVREPQRSTIYNMLQCHLAPSPSQRKGRYLSDVMFPHAQKIRSKGITAAWIPQTLFFGENVN